MSADLGANAGEPVAQYLAEPVDGVGLSGQGAACENEHRTCIEAVDLLRQRLGKGLAEDHAVHRRKPTDAAQHRFLLSLAYVGARIREPTERTRL